MVGPVFRKSPREPRPSSDPDFLSCSFFTLILALEEEAWKRCMQRFSGTQDKLLRHRLRRALTASRIRQLPRKNGNWFQCERHCRLLRTSIRRSAMRLAVVRDARECAGCTGWDSTLHGHVHVRDRCGIFGTVFSALLSRTAQFAPIASSCRSGTPRSEDTNLMVDLPSHGKYLE